MSFIPITTGEIAVGEPVKNSTLTKVKDNFDALNSRVTSVEGGSAVVYPPLVFRINGYYSHKVGQRLLKTTSNFNLTVTGVRVLIDGAGSSGTTGIDIKYRRSGGTYTSVLSTAPSVANSAGDDSVSSNAVLDPAEVYLQTGDIIALDLISVQAGGYGFTVRIDFNKT